MTGIPMKIGISSKLADSFPDLPNVTEQPFTYFDVTVMLHSEHDAWVDKRIRRLRPHFVRDLIEAKRIVELYKAIGGYE